LDFHRRDFAEAKSGHDQTADCDLDREAWHVDSAVPATKTQYFKSFSTAFCIVIDAGQDCNGFDDKASPIPSGWIGKHNLLTTRGC